MFDPALFLLNGALCAVAYWAAAYVHPGRDEARTLALLLAINFLFCALAWTPYAPKHLLAPLGIVISSKDTWMLADALFGSAAVALMFWRWWGWALWSLAFVQVGLHVARQRNLIEPDLYSGGLDIVLHAQLAVFFVIGGRGLVGCLSDFAARLRGVWSIPEAARARAAARLARKGGDGPA